MLISAIRTIVLFLLIMTVIRLLGKRQLGELEPSELVVAVLISDLAATPLQNPGTPLLYGIVPVLTLFCCELVISGLQLRSIRFRSLVCGKPSMIIYEGRVLQEEMQRNRFSIDELLEELRRQSVLDLESVRYAVLEANGSLSIVLNASDSPVTPNTLNGNADPVAYPVLIINNGRVLTENLRALGRDEAWLRSQLSLYGHDQSEGIFLMTADRNGRVTLIPKEARG